MIGTSCAFHSTCIGLFTCTPYMIEHCGVPSKISAIPRFSFIEDFCVGRTWILHCFHSLILNMFPFNMSTPLLNAFKKLLKSISYYWQCFVFSWSKDACLKKIEECYVLCWLSLNGIEWEMYSWCFLCIFSHMPDKIGPLSLSCLRHSPSRRTVGGLWHTKWQHNKEAGKI